MRPQAQAPDSFTVIRPKALARKLRAGSFLQIAVSTYLKVAAPRAVSIEELSEWIWPGVLPDTPEAQIRRAVWLLRKRGVPVHCIRGWERRGHWYSWNAPNAPDQN